MSIFAVDSYEKKSDRSWYNTAATKVVTDQYSYMERSEQTKLRSYFEKQCKDLEIRKLLERARG